MSSMAEELLQNQPADVDANGLKVWETPTLTTSSVVQGIQGSVGVGTDTLVFS